MDEIYFEKIPNVGNLYLSRILNVFEGENIIFIWFFLFCSIKCTII